MRWDFIFALIAGLTQFGSAYLGWKVTPQDQSIDRTKRKWYEVGFVLCGLIGVVCVATLAWRSGRRERAHYSITLGNTYRVTAVVPPSSDPCGPSLNVVPYSWLTVDKPLAFNVCKTNVGTGTAYAVDNRAMVTIEDDASEESQQAAVARFKRWFSTGPRSSATDPKGSQAFFTAHGPILSPEDRDNLIHGRRTLFVVGAIRFQDDFGTHELHICKFLQSQATPPEMPDFIHPQVLEIWHGCDEWDGEHY